MPLIFGPNSIDLTVRYQDLNLAKLSCQQVG